jgi:hypothetical protein
MDSEFMALMQEFCRSGGNIELSNCTITTDSNGANAVICNRFGSFDYSL